MRPLDEIKANNRLWITDAWQSGMAGYIVHPNYKPRQMSFVATWNDTDEKGKEWEHVSVALSRRCPTWDEMCMIKDISGARKNALSNSTRPRASTLICTRIACICGKRKAWILSRQSQRGRRHE